MKVAVIGCGTIANTAHIPAYMANEKAEIKYFCDIIPERAEAAVEKYGCGIAITDYKIALADPEIEAISVCTPNKVHPLISIDAMRAGKNVLCEKPFVPTVEEYDILVSLAESKGLKLLVFQQSRFANYFLKVKEVIASGELGRIVHIGIQFNGFARRWDWQCCLDLNGGNLANTGPHPLDQALNLLDYYDGMPQVFCHMDRCNTFGDAEDYCKLILKAPNRPIIDLDISSCDAYPAYTYKVEGTRGTLKGNMAHIDWKYFIPEDFIGRNGSNPYQP